VGEDGSWRRSPQKTLTGLMRNSNPSLGIPGKDKEKKTGQPIYLGRGRKRSQIRNLMVEKISAAKKDRDHSGRKKKARGWQKKSPSGERVRSFKATKGWIQHSGGKRRTQSGGKERGDIH